MKRNLIIITLVVFALSSVFLFSSCAKKQVVTAEEEMTAAPTEAAKPAVKEEKPAVTEAAKPAVEEEKPAVTEAAKEEVAEEEKVKIERLKELEEAKKAEAAEEKAAAEFDEKEAYRERLAAQVEAESIYFDFDRSFIRPDYRPLLEKKVEFLKEFTEYDIRIEGNCDERGTNEYNLALGDRRAESAKSYLISRGISADRIDTISYGEERPLAVGHNEESWEQNRRDDFVLVKK
jgi:peptidoglycan-associated lipoprotein